MRRKSLIIVLFALITFPLIFGTAQAKQTLTPVIINQAIEHLLYVGLYVAKDKGFFEEQGLDVRIETGGGDAQTFAALTSGSAQFGMGDPAFVAIANERGWQGRVIVMAVDRVAIWGVTFDSKIKPFTNPIGFKGMTVATYPNPNTSYVVQKQLAIRAGLELGKDVKILQVPFGTELATLYKHQADIAQTVEPNVSQVELKGGSVVFSYPEAWGPLAFTGVMTSKKLIDEKPELVQKFVNAYEKAAQYVHNDFEGTIAVAKRKFPKISEDVLRKAVNRLTESKSIPAHVAIDPVSWKRALEVRIEVGDLKSMPDKMLYDNSFADKAVK